MNGPAQVEPSAAAADLVAAHEARAHDAREPRRERMRRRDVFGIDNVTEIGAGQRLNARCAFATAAAVRRRFALVVTPLYMIGKTERLLRHMRFSEPPRRGMTGRWRPG